MINIRNEMSYKNTLTYYIRYVTFKDLEYVKSNNGDLLYLIINKINGYFEKKKKQWK